MLVHRMNQSYFYLVLVISTSCVHLTFARGINGGVGCAACTIMAGIFGQVAEIHNTSLVNFTLTVCDELSWPVRALCHDAVEVLKPVLSILIETRTLTPDTFCYGLNFCHKDKGTKVCHLFPSPSPHHFSKGVLFVKEKAKPFILKWFKKSSPKKAFNPCHLPGVKEICNLITYKFSKMEPEFDPDGDHFSSSEYWRGSNWRGRDCHDGDSNIYPGRQPYSSDASSDSNCNGIWGADKKSHIPWESKFCGGKTANSPRGIIMLGDSIGAHFHFPETWFNPLLISKVTFFRNLSGPLLDEFDWPEHSFSTGFKNISLPILIQGPTDSLYLRLRKHNLCNHRDYQNVCRNGANSYDLVAYVKNVARSPLDKPAIVLVGVFGNDVCNRYPDTLANMTTPQEFYRNIKSVLGHLDSTLPPGSHIVLIGLVDGSFIYNTMANRTHPIGSYHSNVKYHNIYEWFECMQIGPCNGWMSGDDTIRKATTQRAVELSQVLQDTAHSHQTTNVKVHYIENPLLKVIWDWRKKGGQEWQLIESVDGFHPNQVAQPLIADALWKSIKKFAPDVIGAENPYNAEIMRIFGDQGGH